VSETQVIVGDDPDNAIAIEVSTIFRSFTEQEFSDSTFDRLKSRYRHWRGSFDFGFAATQATIDTGLIDFGFEAERKKEPTRLLMLMRYRYAIQQEQDEPENVIENELRGLLRGEYDITKRWFAFASITGEYDEIESLSLRSVPKGGLGYKIWEAEKGFLSADLGMSYVYQEFFGGSTDSYTAVSFGTEAKYQLPYSAVFTARGEYLPSVSEPTGNYLLRGSTAVAVPMLSWLAVKLTLFDEYNNRPAEGAQRNKFTITAGLSMLF
jgi:putative salt-induced outer membrane protein YdiY